MRGALNLRDGVAAARPAPGCPLVTRDGGFAYARRRRRRAWRRRGAGRVRESANAGERGAVSATLVLIVDRAVRGGLLGGLRSQPDGAAPLIGSSVRSVPCANASSGWQHGFHRVDRRGEWHGKELVARQIHELSRRRKGPFVAVNCAAIVETLLEAELFGIEERTATGVRGRRGKFEHAARRDAVPRRSVGPVACGAGQAAASDPGPRGRTRRRHGAQPVDIRIVAATNRPLVGAGRARPFRLDLFYRSNGVEMQVPPLRERRDDILELARYFLERHRAVRPLRLSHAARRRAAWRTTGRATCASWSA